MLRPLKFLLLCLALATPWKLYAQTAAFSISPRSGCAPLAVSFTNQSSGSGNTYQWNLGNSVTTASTSPSTTYGSPGVYYVTLIATGTGGADTTRDSIIVYGGPTVSFSGTTLAGCRPHPTQFSTTVVPNAPGPLQYSWAFGDGTTDTAAAPLHIYQTPGTFTVSVAVTNGPGCVSSAVRSSYVTAWPLPQPTIVADQTRHCGFPATVNFTASAGGALSPYNYSWSYGDGTSGTGPQSAHIYNPGTFTVKSIVTDSRGCTDSAVAPAYIFVLGTVPSFSTRGLCVDSVITFTNTTGTTDTARWDFGDGTRDSGNRVTHVYQNAGTYAVRMSVTVQGCPKVSSQQLVIHPRPKITSRMDPWLPCPPPVTAQLIANSDIPATFEWHWISGGVDIGDTVHRFYPLSTIDTVTIYARSAFGCWSSLYMDTIYLRNMVPRARMYDYRKFNNPLLVPIGGCLPYDALHDADIVTYIPPGAPPPPYPSPITSYKWYFDNGDTSTLPVAPHLYTDTGWVYPKVVMTTANGCTDTARTSERIVAPHHPGIGVTKSSICRRDTFALYLTSPLPHLPFLYYWAPLVPGPLPGGEAYRDTFRFQNRFDTSFRITLYTIYRYCVDTGAFSIPMTVKDPIAKFMLDRQCWPSKTVSFINQSRGADRYLWNFDDGSRDTARAPVHVYQTESTFYPTLITYNTTNGCTDTFNKTKSVAADMVDPGFMPMISRRKACLGRPVGIWAYYPKYMLGDLYPYYYRLATEGDTTSWLFGTDSTAHTFQTTGLHDICLFIRYGMKSCIDTILIPGAIEISKPIVRLGADVRRACVPFQAIFVDSSTNAVPGRPNTNFRWSFYIPGFPDTSNGWRQPIRYKHGGSYPVKLVVTDSAGCQDSLTVAGYINAHETIARFDSASNGAGPDSACVRSLVPFRSASTGFTRLNYNWSFGDGGHDTSVSPVHRYMTRGLFPLTLVATDSIGCADTIQRHRPIQVMGPTAAFTMSGNVSLCPPLQVAFTNHSADATSYRWDFGDGSPGPVVVPNPVTTYLTPGIYRIALVASDPTGCRDTAYDSVRVLGYSGAFSFTPPSACINSIISFSSSVANIPVLTWDFGDGFIDTTHDSRPTSHRYTSSGAFLPKVIFADGVGCSAISNALDSVYIDAVTADFGWSLPCADTPFTLTNRSTAVYGQPASFQWSSPAANAGATGNPAMLKIGNAGTFPVTLIATNAAGCADTVTKNVLVNALPEVWAGPDTAICPGDTAHLAASGTALQYFWAPSFTNPAAALSCTTCESPLTWTATPVVYIVAGKDANGCYGRDSVRVSIQLRTTSTSGPDGQICLGESYQLHAAGADTYQWLPAETLDRPSSASPLATPNTTTTYMVISQEGSCQVDTQRIRVAVNPLPNFSAGPDKTIVLGGAATLEPRGTFTRIEWLYSDTTLSCWDCKNPNAHPYYTRTYWAKATNEFGCESTDSVTVFVRCNGSQVFIPNTFTPNGDGQNDRFYPQGAGLDQMATFRVFNRWGELVFEALNVPLNSAGAGWDGTYKGQALAPDTYVYTMTSRCRTGEIVSFKGDVTLVR